MTFCVSFLEKETSIWYSLPVVKAWFPDFVSYIINPRVRFWNSSAAYEMYTLWRMENVKSNRTHNKFWCQWSSLRGLNDGYRTWWKASQLLLPSQQYNWTITHQPQVLSHNDIYKNERLEVKRSTISNSWNDNTMLEPVWPLTQFWHLPTEPCYHDVRRFITHNLDHYTL